MKNFTLCVLLTFIVLMMHAASMGQVDEVNQVIGLPIPIGAPIIYGQVMIRNMPRGEQRPTVDVTLRVGGAQIDKSRANDQGYWYFLKRPVDGQLIVFQIDGTEMGQVVVVGGISNRLRQDVEFDWLELRGAAQRKIGVVSVRDRYQRNDKAEKAFQTALAQVHSGKVADALTSFESIVLRDDKDFNAWLQIGTIKFNEKQIEPARTAFAKAVSLKPDYFLAVLNLGMLELSQKEFDAAITELGKAVAIDSNSADANHLLGEAYLQNKKGSLAVGFLNKALELAPIAKAEIHLRLGALYNGAGLKDRASLEYKAFLEKVKNYPDRKKLEEYIKENPPKN